MKILLIIAFSLLVSGSTVLALTDRDGTYKPKYILKLKDMQPALEKDLFQLGNDGCWHTRGKYSQGGITACLYSDPPNKIKASDPDDWIVAIELIATEAVEGEIEMINRWLAEVKMPITTLLRVIEAETLLTFYLKRVFWTEMENTPKAVVGEFGKITLPYSVRLMRGEGRIKGTNCIRQAFPVEPVGDIILTYCVDTTTKTSRMHWLF